MPIPLIPLFAGKALIAGGIALYGHRLARRLQTPDHYAAQEPVFEPAKLLVGDWDIDGVAHGPRGRVAARLDGTLTGTRAQDAHTISLALHTDTGQTWEHTCTLHQEGTSLTLTGLGLPAPVQGTLSGNSLRLRYTFALPKVYGGWTLDAEDWMFAMPNGTLAYQGQYHKLGWPVGGVSAFIRPC